MLSYGFVMTSLHTPPTIKFVKNEGTALQTTGMVLAGIGLIGGLFLLIVTQSPVFLGLIPIGLFVAIAGYLKQIAAATTASYILALNEASTKGEILEQ